MLLAATRGQAQPARTAVYAELFGNALMYSLNAERRVGHDVVVRVGAAYLGVEGTGDDALTQGDLFVPVTAGVLLGRRAHHLEVAAGGVLVTNGPSYGTGTLGYRYQRPRGGVVARAGVAVVYLTGMEAWVPWPAASLGYAF